MFCDLVGSTAFWARLDPEDMRRVIRAYQDDSSGVLARCDGFVAKFMGDDGILAYFGFPGAHEDDPGRAVRAGLASFCRISLKTGNRRRSAGLPGGGRSPAKPVCEGLCCSVTGNLLQNEAKNRGC